MPGTKVGIVRGTPGIFNFDSNGNGQGPSPNDLADRIDGFLPPDGGKPEDIPVTGDWAGSGRSAAGWFRPSTGQWFLDFNNDGVFTAGTDLQYTYGFSGDAPVVGDWAGLGKSAVGVLHQGFLWILDLNADGVFQQPTANTNPIIGDAVFAFGTSAGAAPDFPVVGNWNGRVSINGFPISQAGMVRTFSAGGGPALWMMDSGLPGTFANVTPQSGHGALVNSPGIAYGGLPGDIPVAGDWFDTGVTQFGDFRQGFLWMLDGAVPGAPQASHFNGLVFPYGGLAGDRPVTGKW